MLIETYYTFHLDTLDIQVVWWEMDMDDSCFCAHVLLYWVENGTGLSVCPGNVEI